MTRHNTSGVCERRGCATSDNCRGFVDQLVVLKSLYHEEGIVHPAPHVALQDGITHVLTPHGKALAFALKIAPTHDRPPGVAGKHPPTRFHLVVDIHDGNKPREPDYGLYGRLSPASTHRGRHV